MPMQNYTITFNDLTIGNGTLFQILNIEGLGGTAPLRIQDDNRGYIDGSYTGRDFYDERQVFIDVLVLGDNSSTAQENYKDLQRAFAPQPLGYYPDPTGFTPQADELKLFQFRLNGDTGDKQMYGRSRGLQTTIDADFTYGYIQTRIQMTFPDPRYYDDVGTTVTGTNVSLINNGWAISCPVIKINSTSATSGYVSDGITYMNFANMATGKKLFIDLLHRVIYYDDEPRRNIMTAASSGWLELNPDSASIWTSTVGSMSITYRNAYI